jgi:ligand-binding sensor domain-containing protein/signal transduction histidine kinase
MRLRKRAMAGRRKPRKAILNGEGKACLAPIRWLISALLLASGAMAAHAADKAAPVHNVDGAFVREWLVLGPFPSKILETDFLSEAGGEARVRPQEGDTVTRSDGTQLTWTRLRSGYDLVNLEKVLGIQTWSVAYAYCELSSDQSIETDLRIHAIPTPPARLWLNGKELGRARVLAGSSGNVPLAQPVRLEAGPNRCLLKLKVESSEWVFSVQPLPPERATVELLATDPEGRPIADALIQFYEKGEPVRRLRTGASGRAEAFFSPPAEACDLRVTSGETGVWLHNLALQPGERRQLDLELAQAVSISGRVLAIDGSPQKAIVVQALRVSHPSESGRADLQVHPDSRAAPQRSPPYDGRIQSLLPMPPFSETVLSDTNGYYRFVNLRPGAYRLRCHGPDGFAYPNGDSEAAASAPVIVAPGRTNESVQFVFAQAKKGVWRNYPITKGLTQLNPCSVHRTPDGRLWVGTVDGTLHSYDGVEFKTYQAPEIPGNEVIAINHDAAGTLWIGTSNGLSRSVDGRFEPFPSGGSLPRSRVNAIVADPNGTVWFGTASGLYRYAGGKFAALTIADGLPGNVLISLMQARDGALWTATRIGLARFENGNVSEPAVFPEFIPEIEHLHQDRNGAIWFSSPDMERGGVFRFDGTALRRLGTEEGLLSERVFDIAETSDGVMWFATRDGLWRFNGTRLVNYTVEDGLSNEWVRDIFVDEDDVLWLANGWGVSRFDPEGFISFTKEDGFKNGEGATPGVLALEPDQEGGFWVGTEWGGVYRIGRHRDQPVLTSVYPQAGYVRQIHRADDGTLWFGTGQGIFKEREGVLTKVLDRNWVIALTSDARARLWFGHGWDGGGVSRYDPLTGDERLFTRAQGLPDDYVWSLERDRGGGVWIGTGAGLARARGDTIDNWEKEAGFEAAAIFHLRHDANDRLWMATRRGLHRLEGDEPVSLSIINGLPDEHVWCSARTSDGVIWIGTSSHGLVGYDGRAMTVVDNRDGLSGNKVFSLATDGEDALWMGFLDGGLTRYRRSRTPPAVRLVEVRLDDQTLTHFSTIPKTEIGRHITVQYQEIDLKTHPDKRQFWYRLATASGQTVLSGVTKERRFDWTPSAGGTYHFEVQAIDRDLNYSEPARLTFRATVPWHANAWITVPGGGGVAGLLVWAFIVRILYLGKRREADRLQERARIARDLHDQLGAGLTHLAILGDILRQRSDQPTVARSLAGRLSESAYELSRTMGQVIWATDPAKDTLRSFVSFVSSYAEKFLGGSEVRLRLDFPAEFPEVLLPAQLRHGLFMVVKEALNNAAKHAQASQVRIRLELSDRELRLSFEDNGRGFLKSQVGPECHGLANMEKRLSDLGGHLEIDSAVGRGTRVQARVPLPGSRSGDR